MMLKQIVFAVFASVIASTLLTSNAHAQRKPKKKKHSSATVAKAAPAKAAPAAAKPVQVANKPATTNASQEAVQSLEGPAMAAWSQPYTRTRIIDTGVVRKPALQSKMHADKSGKIKINFSSDESASATEAPVVASREPASSEVAVIRTEELPKTLPPKLTKASAHSKDFSPKVVVVDSRSRD